MRSPVRGALAGLAALALVGATGCEVGAGSAASEVSPSAVTTAPQTAAPPSSSASPTTEPTPSPTLSATPTPGKPKASTEPGASAALLAEGARGTQVRELQHRLRQLDWYAGDITGRYQATTVGAVRGFQEKRSLAASGEVDRRTWAKLTSMTREPTDDELHNRLRAGPALLQQGSTGDRVRDLQARLKQIAWFSGSITGSYGSATADAVRGFQAKRAIPATGEVDQRTLDRLTAMTRTPTRDEKHNVVPKPSATGLDPRCLTGRAMCVSKTTNSLVWVVDGQPRVRVDVRFGSQELPTREGSFSVGWKSRNHVSTLYHTPMPFAMFFSGGQAVHYSPDFAANGYSGASHGCVNVRDRAAIEGLFNTVRVGDKVIVYR